MADGMKAVSNPDGDEQAPVEVVPFDDAQALIAAITGETGSAGGERPTMGLAFPDRFEESLFAGERPTVLLYTDGTIPERLSRVLDSEVRELGYGLAAFARGQEPAEALPVRFRDVGESILGEDRTGHQVPLQEKMRPMLMLLILMIGGIGLAGLVAVEIEQRTATALLVTPLRTSDLLAAKVVTGTLLGLTQGAVFALATWSFGGHPLLVLLLLLLGAAMMSAVGMLSGAAGKDFMGTMVMGVVLILPLIVPTFSMLFPGTPSLWIRALPTYGLVQAMLDVVGYGRGWGDVLGHLGLTVAWIAVLFGIALAVLRRRLEAP
jgi:ABC-2 type transport system permease protein